MGYTNNTLSRITRQLNARLTELDSVDLIDRIIYVETTGNDTTGDGKSVSTAFLTFEAALNDIKAVVNGCKITIQFGTGTFDITSNVFSEFSEKSLVNDSQLVFTGNGYNEIVSGLTLTPDVDKPYHYSVSGATFIEDEYNEAFVLGISGALTYGIFTNGTNTLETFIGADVSNSIYTYNTTINIDGDSISLIPKSRGTKIKWEKILFDFNGNNFNFGQKSDEVLTTIKNSIIKCKMVNIGSGYRSSTITFNHVYIITYDPDNYASNGFNAAASFFGNAKFILRSDIVQGVRGLQVRTGTTLSFIKIIIYNYKFPIELLDNSKISFSDFNNTVSVPNFIIKDASVAFGLNNNTVVSIPEQNQDNTIPNLYIENVDYLVGSLYRAVDRPTYYPYKNVNFDVFSLKGTPNIANLEEGVLNYVNSENGVYINIPGIYPEISRQTTSSLIDNATTNLIIGDASQNRSLFVNYSGDRNSTYEQGKLMMLNNDVSITMLTENTIGDIGLTFEPSINGSNEILLQCTLTSTGNDASIKYDITRTLI